MNNISKEVMAKLFNSTIQSIYNWDKNKPVMKLIYEAFEEKDIIEWLEPDWVINTNNGEVYNGNFTQGQILISKYIEQHIISGQCLRIITI